MNDLLTQSINLGPSKDFARVGCESLVAQGKWITAVEQNEAHDFVVAYDEVRPEGKRKALDWEWELLTSFSPEMGF